MSIKTFYSFKAWTKGSLSDFFDSDSIELYDECLGSLIEKIKLFNKVACFECWTSLQFFKWSVTYLENDIEQHIIKSDNFPEMIGAHKIKVCGRTIEQHIIKSDNFPEMIGAHKIKVWGRTYEI